MMNPRFLKKAISIVMAIALLMMSCMPVMAEDIHTVNGEPQKQEAVVASNAEKANEAKEEKEEVKAQSTVAPTAGAGTEGSNGTEGGTGGDTGAGTGGDTGAGTGSDTGAGTGDNTGAGTGDNTGAGTGDNTGAGTGDNTGAGTGGDTGAGTGDNTGAGTGGETNPKPFAECDITITTKFVTYNGKSQKPGVSVMDGTTPLKEGVDYEVKFSRGVNVETDFINAGKITVEIISLKKEEYTDDGLESLTYIINPKKLDDVDISLAQTEIVYDGNEHKLVPAVSELSDEEYSVDYKSEGKDTPDFKNAGKIGVVVTVTNNPNYTGSKTVYYTIIPMKGDPQVTLEKDSVPYNEAPQKPTIASVTLNGNSLSPDDYTVSYKRGENEFNEDDEGADFTNAGTIEITVTLKGNYEGSKNVEYTIVPKPNEDAKVEVTLKETSVIYNGAAQKPTIASVTLNGNSLSPDDYTVSYKRGENEFNEDDENADFTNVGTITVVVTPKANDNYIDLDKISGTKDFTINPKSLEDKDITLTVTEKEGSIIYGEESAASFTYDGEEHKPDSIVVAMGEDTTLTEGEDKDYTVTYTREGEDGDAKNFTNAGKITMEITGHGNFKDSVTIEYTITKLKVALEVADKTKNYGEKTPEFTVGFATEDIDEISFDVANEIGRLLTMKVAGTSLDRVNDVVEQTVKFVENADHKLSEEPGTYDIVVTVGTSENIDVTVNEGDPKYKINNKIHLTVPEKIDSHTAKLDGFEVKCVADEDKVMPEFATMAGNIKLTATISIPNGVVIPYTYDESAFKWKYDDENFTVSNGQVLNTTVFFDGADDWETYIPAGMVITYTAKTENGADLVIIGEDGTETVPKTEVVATPVTITVSATENRFYSEAKEEVEYFILAEDASLFVTANDEKGGITSEDWIEFKNAANPEDVFYFKANENGQIEIDPDDIKLLLNESEDYMNPDPQNYAEIIFTMVDKHNHTVEDKTIRLCVDTEAVQGGVSTVGNREDNAVCDLLDSVGSIMEITGNYGSVVMNAAKGKVAGQQLTIELTGWRDTPDQLPRSGDVITIKYKDKVGHEVTHMLNIVKSPAQISNTISVTLEDPVKNANGEYVVGKTLKLAGSTTKCEKLILRIGGKTITIDPQKMENPYNSGEYTWMKKVNLDELGIPVGVPQTVTISYDDLAGGEDSTRITYKDHAMTPSLSCDLVEGTKRFWGFLEENVQNLYITINRANGGDPSRLSVENAILLNRTKGYFYVELVGYAEELAAGDEVIFTVTDLCGNQITYSKVVGTETSEHKAMLLGANIMDEISVNINGEIKDEYMHAFATPIDVEKLAGYENQSMTLPILACDAIEIGTMTISLNGTQIDVEYNISEERFNSTYIPEDAKVYWSTYTEKPTVDELLNGNHRTAKLEMSGALKPIDASVNVDENGEPKGVVWLYAAIDVKVDANVVVKPYKYNITPYIWADRKEIEEKYGEDKLTFADKQDDYFALYNDFYNEANRAA